MNWQKFYLVLFIRRILPKRNLVFLRIFALATVKIERVNSVDKTKPLCGLKMFNFSPS